MRKAVFEKRFAKIVERFREEFSNPQLKDLRDSLRAAIHASECGLPDSPIFNWPFQLAPSTSIDGYTPAVRLGIWFGPAICFRAPMVLQMGCAPAEVGAAILFAADNPDELGLATEMAWKSYPLYTRLFKRL